MNLKDKIKQTVRLEEVVERYLPLQRRSGSGKTLVGLCPFHADRHPSLHINTKEQYYKCFACGQGGDLFTFVQGMEGCDFREALKIVAGWYGLSDTNDVPVTYQPRKRAIQVKPQAETLFSPIHKAALLRSHQMILDLLETYTPEEEVLYDAYKHFEVGISTFFLPPSYTSLCNRLIFPIRNEWGELVAFAGRYRGDTAATDIPKYINSPNSIIYQKGELLYGLYQAREAIRRHGFVYITEGYKDVLAMHAAGFCNTVALCGIALTELHAALLKKYTCRVIVMLDGDEAGQVNGVRSARLLGRKGFTVGRIIPEPKQDPDSLLRQMGKVPFTGYMKSATRLSRLEAYEADLLKQKEQKLFELKLALTIAERAGLLTAVMTLHKRLSKVTKILAHGPALKMQLVNLK